MSQHQDSQVQPHIMCYCRCLVSFKLLVMFSCPHGASRSHAVSLKDMQHELEQLTKELRQVNLQQFIKQTGTKVTVLPAEPSEDESTHSSHGIGNIILF